VIAVMRYGQDVLADVKRALACEWQLANGIGGSASGTAAGGSARRDQALLTICSPHGRATTILLRLEERLQGAAGAVELGRALPEEFRLEPWPTWRWRIGDTLLEKRLFLLHGHHAAVITYRSISGPDVELTLSPLVVARAPDRLQRSDPALCGAVQGQAGRVRIELGAGQPALSLWHNGAFLPARVWQRGIAYPGEPADGSDEREDALVPGHVSASLRAGEELHLVAAAEDGLFRELAIEGRLGTPPPRTLAACLTALEPLERAHLESWERDALAGADFTARQAAAAHGGPGEEAARRPSPLLDGADGWTLPLAQVLGRGLVRRGNRVTLVRTLPSAAEDPAEALRAVAGLIAIRAFDAARAVLRGAIECLDEGLAPATFDAEDGYPKYGDPEPSLWLIHAADLLARRTEDVEFTRVTLVPPLDGVMQSFRSGTRHGVRVERDGLLWAGEGNAARARADLNALWYHALVAMAQLARLAGSKQSSAFYLAWAHEHQKCFQDHFWSEERGALHEVIGARGPEPGLTPGQLLAVCLPPSPLRPEAAATLMGTIERELFTPLGLRARPGSSGDRPEWLGAFYRAYLRAHSRSPEAQAQVQAWLAALRPRLQGGPPLTTLAAGELLRTWIEEVDHAGEPAGVA
jgi:glycogen debranching enzyme